MQKFAIKNAPGKVRSASPNRQKTTSAQAADNHHDIAALAYQLWEERGCPRDDSQQDWYEALRRLASEAARRHDV